MRTATKRFDIKWQVNDTWAIVDIFTGAVAEHEGKTLDGMTEAGSAQLCTILNAIDRKRRQDPLS